MKAGSSVINLSLEMEKQRNKRIRKGGVCTYSTFLCTVVECIVQHDLKSHCPRLLYCKFTKNTTALSVNVNVKMKANKRASVSAIYVRDRGGRGRGRGRGGAKRENRGEKFMSV